MPNEKVQLLQTNIFLQALAISEVEIKRGTARATDESLNPAWKAEGAFIINHPYGWHSGG